MNAPGDKTYHQTDNQGHIYNSENMEFHSYYGHDSTDPQITVNWRELCSAMLKPQLRMTSNPLMQDESAKKERKQIYVPLALVQRTKTDKRNKEDFSPDAGTRLYEPEYETQQRFEHEAFLSQILELGEGKTKGQQIAVIGEPGAGKTTLLQAIAFWVLDKGLGLPVWVSLADLGRNGTLTDIQTYICNSWLEQAIPSANLTPEVRDDFTKQIQQGRVWLLLDGVDEIFGGGASHQPLEEISRQLTGWLGYSSRVVLTCRLNVWQADGNALETFETYRLLDFDYPQQVHQFIDNWFVEEIEKGGRLKTELDSAERVRLQDMVQTPLRLALLCSIWQSEEGNLPQTKAGLYHKCVKQFYTWKQNRFRTSTQEQQDLNQALGRLALRDIEEGVSRFRLLESFIIEELGAPDDENSLFYKALQLGWLNHVGIAAESDSTEEKVYAFFHATFEEYFAALTIDHGSFFLNHILENPNAPSASYRIFEPQWKEVFLFWLGGKNVKNLQKENLIQSLVNFEDGCQCCYSYRAFFLATIGIAEFKEYKLSDEIAEKIVKYAFGYFDEQKYTWKKFIHPINSGAQAALQQTDTQRAIQALARVLKTTHDDDTRWRAAYCLGKIDPGNNTAIQALVQVLNTIHDNDTRCRVAYCLGKIDPGNNTAIQALARVLKTTHNKNTRWRAACSFREIGTDNDTAIQALEQVLETTHDDDTRCSVAYCLGKIDPGNKTAIQALARVLKTTHDDDTRTHAAYWLGEIGTDNDTAIQTLEQVLETTHDDNTRTHAAYCLGKIDPGNKTAIQALTRVLETTQAGYTHIQAAYHLGEIDPGNKTAIQALTRVLETTHEEHACGLVAYHLGEIDPGNKTAIQALVQVLKNTQDKGIRTYAAYCLGEIGTGNDTAIQALLQVLETFHDKDIRWRAAYSLSKIKQTSEQYITLVKLLHGNLQDEPSSQLILECANELLYTDFYRAFNSPISKVQNRQQAQEQPIKSFFGSVRSLLVNIYRRLL